MTERMMETTLYSLDPGAPKPERADQRNEERHLTLYRVGSFESEGRRELCLIKNISAGGMMIRAYCKLGEGSRLTIELKTGEPIAGIVKWVKGQNVGVAFDTPIDILDILSASMDGPRPRMPRIEVDCPINLYIDGQPVPARALDISQGGIKVAVRGPLPAGDKDLGVALSGIAPIRASVRWQDSETAGITFNTLLPLADLVRWLGERRDPLRKAG